MEVFTCSIGKVLNKPCNKLDYTRSPGVKKLTEFNTDYVETLLWRAGLKDDKNWDKMTICFHHEQVLSAVFEHKNDKCCRILKHHKRKAQGKKLVTLEMAKQLHEKMINVIPGYMLCRQCVDGFESTIFKPETEIEEENAPSDEDPAPERMTESSDEDFEILETPRKKLNSTLSAAGISPITLHGIPLHNRPTCAKSKLSKVFQKFQTNISEVYDVDNVELESSGSASNVNVEVRKKAVELDMLHTAMKIKLKTVTNPEKIQILTLAPNLWSRKFCAEYFDVSEYLVRTARELKKEKGILANPEPKQGKKLSKETVQLIQDFYVDDEYSRQMPGKKD